MENVLDAVAWGMLTLVSLVLFVIVIKTLIPTFLLKVKYSLDKGLGRGLKKFSYPTGRAVLYEPHPSLRKYINRYLLFVNDGYKYLKCSVDAGVKNLKFDVIMLNNKNKVVDVASVDARIGISSQTRDILLHPDTSYVAINLESANGYDVKRIVSGNYTLLQIGLYFAAMFLVAFLELLFVSSALESLFTIALSRKILLGASSFYFICSLFIAAAAVCIVLASGRKKGIGVVINGKK